MTSRRELLRQVLNPEPHRVEISEQRFASTQLDIKKMLLKALEGGHEGIMIKTLDDGYVINERKDKAVVANIIITIALKISIHTLIEGQVDEAQARHASESWR